ncbi:MULTISPECIES: universal stress protein [Pacificibacter]|uniref:universal stress protein n=1 Tax=Pacificibacter TaxID=1042323 RepID=UPI001C091FA1|nr:MULTISPECIES: universal stress protein [Pacificibacter]MBU2935543.1 universal stress protein [Pacificibacter marinus]MDO6614040.1 universal stress protein [Pacificibacter sp. 1_MG-2023]
MSSSILCAVDVSNGKDDFATIQVAQKMADLEGAQLDVIAVVPDFGMSPVGGFFSKDHHDKMLVEAKAMLNRLMIDALGTDNNDKIRHIVATGKAYEEVLKLADKTTPSLIVVGSHKAEKSHYMLGPNAARIVRHANCSVYVVR